MDTDHITNVKQIAAILYSNQTELDRTYELLSDTFSAVDYKGSYHPFVESDYYEPEMGKALKRGMISFQDLVHPESLAQAKKTARDLENQLGVEGNRRVNIDIGYMDMFKVVLASFKGRSNKIYLSDGVWADMIMYYEKGDFQTFLWGFPDFKSGIYNADLAAIRDTYKRQLKQPKIV